MEERQQSHSSIVFHKRSTLLNAQHQLIQQIQVQLPRLAQRQLSLSNGVGVPQTFVHLNDRDGYWLDGGSGNIPVSELDLAQTIYRGFAQDPNAILLVDFLKKERITASTFQCRLELIARNLLCMGFKKGDIVAYFVSNSIEAMLFIVACIRIGLIPAGCSTLQRTEELRRQLEICGASLVFTDLPLVMTAVTASRGNSNVKKIILKDGIHQDCVSLSDMLSKSQEEASNLPPLPSFKELNFNPDDLALIIFSSGTTGCEKAVLLSHRNIQTQFTVSVGENVRKIQNNQVVSAPFAHLSGSIITMFGMSLGFTTYLLTKFSLNHYLQLLSQNKIRTISVVPVIANLLAKSPEVLKYDLSSLKEIVCGTAPVSREVIDLLLARFPGLSVRQAYGLSESSGMCTMVPGLSLKSSSLSSSHRCHAKPGSVGVPLPYVKIKFICPKTQKVMGPRQHGEIYIQSPMVMLGYKDARKGFVAPVAVDSEGWLRTGDLGYFDEDGHVFIVDRLKDFIKYRSYQVSPIELESVLMQHNDVVDAGVFGVPHSDDGCQPAAWVVTRPNSSVTAGELLKYVSEKVALFKQLRGGIDIVDKIPRNHSGKILRREMKKAPVKN